MTSEYLESLRLSYGLYLKYGLKHAKFISPFQQSSPAELIQRDENVNINVDLRPKILLTIQDTRQCGIYQGFLNLFRYFRFYITKSNIIQYYFFDEDGKHKRCIPVKNSEQYLLTLMSEKPDFYKIFDEMYDFHLKTGSDIITFSRSINKIILTKSHLFRKILKYIIDQKLKEFQIDDSNVITSYASYWMAFARDCIIYSDDIPGKPDYRTFTHELDTAFKCYCVATNNNYALGLPKLKKLLNKYNRTARMPFITPTGIKSTKAIRAYVGFLIKNPLPEAKVT